MVTTQTTFGDKLVVVVFSLPVIMSNSSESWDVLGSLDAAMAAASPSPSGDNGTGTFSGGGFSRVRFGNGLDGRVGTELGDDDDDEEDVLEDLKPRAFGRSEEFGSVEPHVRVILLDDPSRLCRGLVNGGGDRFCLKEREHCTVKRHQKVKADLASDHFYIMCPKNGWAYIAPSLSQELVTQYLPTVLDMELGVTEWQCLFASVTQDPLESVEDLEDRRLTFVDGTARSRTPRPTKKPRVARTPDLPRMLPLYDKSEEDPQAFLLWIASNWEMVNKRFGDLAQNHAALGLDCKAMSVDIDMSATALALLRSEMGARGDDIQDADVWAAIRNIRAARSDAESGHSTTQLLELKTRGDSTARKLEDLTKDVDAHNDRMRTQLRGLAEAFPRHVGPCRTFVAKYTSRGSDDPGDLLEQRLAHLEGRPALASHGRGFLDPAPDSGALVSLQRQVSSLVELVHQQAVELATVKGRVGQTLVEIQGHSFQSVGDVEDFIRKDLETYSKGFFFDAVSLLEIVHGNLGKSGAEIIESEYHAKRSDYGSDLEAKYAASFKSVTLPSIFGAEVAGSSHAFALPGIKTFAAWDPQDGLHDGEKQRILNGIENQVGSLTASFENIYPAGSKLAAISNQLLSDSVLFIRTLCSFMTEFYTEMSRSSSSGDVGNWSLTCQIVHRLFKDLAFERNCGGETRHIADPIKRGAKYLWFTLQTHRVMTAYMSKKFKEHPSIAPMLNLSLFRTMATNEKLEALRESCRKIEATAQGAKVAADKALSAANAGKGQGKRELVVKP